jgi:hypothetical protein
MAAAIEHRGNAALAAQDVSRGGVAGKDQEILDIAG